MREQEDIFFNKERQDIIFHPDKWQIISTALDSYPNKISSPNKKLINWVKTHKESHNEREIRFILSGNCYFSFNGNFYHGKSGTVQFIDNREVHSIHYLDKNTSFDNLIIHINKKYFTVYFFSHSNNKRILRKPSPLLIKNSHSSFQLESIWSTLSEKKHLDPKLLQTTLIASLWNVLLEIIDFSFKPKEKTTFQENIIEICTQYIETSSNQLLTIEKLAKRTGYSKFHLARIFKKHTGKTIHQYTNFCQKKRTMKMVSEGYTKATISEKLGFSCPQTFSRWYKDNLG